MALCTSCSDIEPATLWCDRCNVHLCRNCYPRHEARHEDAEAEPIDWEACYACMGAGWFHECGEDSCCCADPEDSLGPYAFDCEECKGAGELPVYERKPTPPTPAAPASKVEGGSDGK